MTDLSYGDNIGLVDYAVEARIETGLNEDGADATVNLGFRIDVNTIPGHQHDPDAQTGRTLLEQHGNR